MNVCVVYIVQYEQKAKARTVRAELQIKYKENNKKILVGARCFLFSKMSPHIPYVPLLFAGDKAAGV